MGWFKPMHLFFICGTLGVLLGNLFVYLWGSQYAVIYYVFLIPSAFLVGRIVMNLIRMAKDKRKGEEFI